MDLHRLSHHPRSATPEDGTPTSVGAPAKTRTGAMWTALVVGAILLIALIIFIAENGQRAKISFVGLHAHLPLGVALLVAAVAGSVITLVVGTARIAQLRLELRRHRHRAAEAAADRPSAGASRASAGASRSSAGASRASAAPDPAAPNTPAPDPPAPNPAAPGPAAAGPERA